jgi:DNA mismatch repair ATPase MutL
VNLPQKEEPVQEDVPQTDIIDDVNTVATDSATSQVTDAIAIKQQAENAINDVDDIKGGIDDDLEYSISVERTQKTLSFMRVNGLHQDSKQMALSFNNSINAFKNPEERANEIFARTRILGVAFRTYLILELEDKVIFVDQHAAHERILFDKLMADGNKHMQDLIFPYTFSVKEDEADFIASNIDSFLNAGIEIEEFGQNTFRITAISTLLVGSQMDKFVEYMLSSIEEMRVDERSLIVETIAKKACKAAVKGGEKMSDEDIKFVVTSIYENKILQCPHGRPITVVYTKSQLEKMFKRIV